LKVRREILFWTAVVAIGGAGVYELRRIDHAFAVATPKSGEPSAAERLARARIGNSSLGPATQAALTLATKLNPFAEPVALKSADYVAPAKVDRNLVVASIAAPDGAEVKLRQAMQRPAPRSPRASDALAALTAATGGGGGALRPMSSAVAAYGELAPYQFWDRRLTILQIGDSHTAADFFSGRVRERLQQAFGDGGEILLAPGRPHPGVLSAQFTASASGDWSYESVLRSDDDRRRLHLSGFNAVAHRADAALTFKSRNNRVYDEAEVSFLEQPNGGKAQVLLDGSPVGEVELDGGGKQVTFQAKPKSGQGFRELEVRTLDDSPVTVTGVEVARQGDGVSYLSIGYPGATVQLLQKLDAGNLSEDIRRIAPDILVLAFGTNEGFNDNLDVNAYISQYEQIVRRLQASRPGLKIVIIGPADAARPVGQCHAEGVGQKCTTRGVVTTASLESTGSCKLPIPPKLNAVREAQRKLAQKLGAAFWDWSQVQGGVCGAQAWAAASPPLMAHDYVHMTLEGYKQSADRFADFLIPLIEGRSATHVVSNN
jgi:lysophospholipase L1-like esterase